jgi:hypothetical protein
MPIKAYLLSRPINAYQGLSPIKAYLLSRPISYQGLSPIKAYQCLSRPISYQGLSMPGIPGNFHENVPDYFWIGPWPSIIVGIMTNYSHVWITFV